MRWGIIEPYKGGFLEIIPEGEYSDYWLIAAIHVNGKVFCPSPRFYRNEQQALRKAQKIFDWIASYDSDDRQREFWNKELGIFLWSASRNNI